MSLLFRFCSLFVVAALVLGSLGTATTKADTFDFGAILDNSGLPEFNTMASSIDFTAAEFVADPTTVDPATLLGTATAAGGLGFLGNQPESLSGTPNNNLGVAGTSGVTVDPSESLTFIFNQDVNLEEITFGVLFGGNVEATVAGGSPIEVGLDTPADFSFPDGTFLAAGEELVVSGSGQFTVASITASVAIPEPGSLGILGGLASLLVFRRRR